MKSPLLLLLLLVLAPVTHSHAAPAKDVFAENVRTTEPLSPEEERGKFHLPPGFQIQLVAAEPDLRKPMNMAFDSVGRLWVTESREYPFAATNDATARDTIRIFSDFDDNGRARKVTTFATNLNIPIGLYPFRAPRGSGQQSALSGQQKPGTTQPSGADRRPLTADGLVWKCLVWSIPNIYLLEDTDGDGIADKKELLYGPFDTTRDTHGNQASFRRGMDGWIYATHGFNNQSRVHGRDGHEIFLPSGNIYRFKLDGSRIEHWTHGQVNPFGLCFDPLGNLYSADCHSSPIYQLLRGAHYPSFGRPHDGLGFGPTTIQHSHGSTAIAGIVYISDLSWPAEYQNNIFIGNVMTSRINRDEITFTGSTSKGKEMPDFLRTDDPWFRPVDLQFGPDGALWVADFYNRIIGHYEVPLLHPGRDRERGRLWRIVPPVGADVRRLKLASAEKSETPHVVTYNRDELIGELKSPNPTRHALAREELALQPDVTERGALHQIARGLENARAQVNHPDMMASVLWLLKRSGTLDEPVVLAALKAEPEIIRVHSLRILTERGLQAAATSARPGASAPASGVNAALLAAARTALADTSAHVQRAAADALAANPHADNLAPLLALQKRVPAEDTHLAHVVRLALREQLRLPGALAKLSNEKLSEADARAFASVAGSVTNAEAATFLLKHVQAHTEPAEVLARYITHAARYAPDAELGTVATLAKQQFAADLDTQAALFKSLQEGLASRGGALPPDLRAWGTELAGQLLAPAAQPATWTYVPLNPDKPGRNPFAFEERNCADGQRVRLMSSFPHGETLTGVLRSPVFVLPKQLSFYLCGHDGFPQQPAGGKNYVRLRLVSDTDKAEASDGRADLPVGLSLRPSGEESPLTIGMEGRAAVRPYHDGGLSRAVAGLEVPTPLPHPGPLPLGEGNRSAALETSRVGAGLRGAEAGLGRAASPLLPAGEGRDEGESGRSLTASGIQLEGTELGRPEAIPSRAELPAALPLPGPLPLGEGNRPAALEASRVGAGLRGAEAGLWRAASPLLPAGEGRGEGESGRSLTASGTQLEGTELGRPEAVPSRAELRAVLPLPSPLPLGEGNRPAALEASRVGAGLRGAEAGLWRPASLLLPAGEGRDEGERPRLQPAVDCLQAGEARFSVGEPFLRVGEPLLCISDSFLRIGERLLRLDEPFLRISEPLLRVGGSLLRCRNDFPTRRNEFGIRMNDFGTRRNELPSRLDASEGRECVILTHLKASDGRLEPAEIHLAAAPAAGALPKGVVREAKVPRNDTARKITWDLADVAGKRAVIEVTDGDDGKAYAWLAFGRFAPALPELTLGEVQSLARRQQSGADLARSLMLDQQAPVVAAVAKLFQESGDGAVRAAAGRAWLALDAPEAFAPVQSVTLDATQPEALRAELAIQLADLGFHRVVVAALTNAPTRLQTRFAAALVSTAAGAEQLLTAAEAGRVPARLLQDRTLTDRLRASPARDATVRLAALVKNLPPADVQLQKMIEARRAGFDAKQASAARGAEAFTKACAVCHQLAGQGALVGPQLDGIGGRGLERLLEDILDPNRNVDRAFRTTVFVLRDGESVSGLFRREEGATLVYALANGQEARVPKTDVKERRETETSLMPANFHEALTAAELNDLLAFLLGKPGK